jgi:PAS domain S-box-containing protein
MCILTATGLLSAGAYLNGGFGTLALFWFPAVPLVAMFFVGRWLAAVTGTLLVIELAVLYALHQAGHAFPTPPPTAEYQTFFLAGAIFAVVFTVLLASLYESARERAQLARDRSEERYALAVAGARDVLWDWQVGHALPYFSPRLAELIGRDVSQCGNFHGLLTVVHADDREATREAVAACLRTGGTLEIELRIVTARGEVRWFDARGQGVDLAGRVVRMAGSLRDITRSKQAESDLAAHAAELERSNRDLEQFAYVASHDLREPLRTVSSFSQLLARRYEGQLGPEADEYIAAIVDGGQRMHALIRDLLDYARLSRRHEPAAPTSMSDALDAALADLRVRIEESQATIERGPLAPVLADPQQMTRLLQNLLSNALKFRGEAAPVVRVAAQRTGDEVVLEVADNGIGLDQAHADRIFEIFQRLHTRDRYPGTGIGLAVCKRIAEQNGGRIWVESRLGHGATFKVALPALDV